VVSVTLSPKLVEKLKKRAEKEGKSRSMIVEAALKDFFK
jgi:predicted transcriptional regulator